MRDLLRSLRTRYPRRPARQPDGNPAARAACASMAAVLPAAAVNREKCSISWPVTSKRKLPGNSSCTRRGPPHRRHRQPGSERYAILVRGRGGLDGNFLLDLNTRRRRPAPRPRCRKRNGPAKPSACHRATSVQAIAPAFLAPVSLGVQRHVLKELLPSQDRGRSINGTGNGRLEGVIQTMGQVAAWAHLRTGGAGRGDCRRMGGLGAAAPSWRAPLLDYAWAMRDAWSRGLAGV